MSEACLPDSEHCHVLTDVDNIDWSNADFADYGHFNRQGGEKFANLLEQYIKSQESRFLQ